VLSPPYHTFAEKRLADIPLVVLDTETTGLHVGEGHRITEIGAVRLEKWQPVAQISQLVNPQRPISAQSQKVSGISPQDVANQPIFAEIYPQLAPLLDGALLVAHKAVFDATFIGLEVSLTQGFPPKPNHLPLANPWLCTLKLAQKYFHFGFNNLGNLARQLGVNIGKAHRALNDARATAEVLRHLSKTLAKQHKFRTVGDLLFAQGEPIYSPPLPQVTLPTLIAEAMQAKRPLRLLYTAQPTERWVTLTPKYAQRHQSISYLIGHNHDTKTDEALMLHLILSAE